MTSTPPSLPQKTQPTTHPGIKLDELQFVRALQGGRLVAPDLHDVGHQGEGCWGEKASVVVSCRASARVHASRQTHGVETRR